MSHFSKIKTKMTNENAAIEALRELGYKPTIHAKPVRLNNTYGGARRQKMKAHIVVSSDQLGQGTDFGLLRHDDGSYEIVTDTYFSRAEDLVKKLPAVYAKQVVIQKAIELGDEYTVNERFEDGVFAGYTIVVDKVPDLLAGHSSVSSQLYSSY